MSFGDITAPALSPLASSSIIASPSSALAEPTGDIAALTANTAALEACTARLRKLTASRKDGETTTTATTSLRIQEELRSMRQLRAQNRALARSASRIASGQDRQVQNQTALALARFASALRDSADAERGCIDAVKTMASSSAGAVLAFAEDEKVRQVGSESTPLLQSQRQRQEAVAREIVGNENLGMERSKAVRDIQGAVGDVQAIMKDLADMLGEQGAQLEYISVAVEESSVGTQRAQEELRRANQRRQRGRKLFYYVLVFVALVVSIVLIILLS